MLLPVAYLASVVTSLDTRHQKSCFHKAQIKVTGQGRNAPARAPVGIQYYFQHILQTKIFCYFFVIFETLSVC